MWKNSYLVLELERKFFTHPPIPRSRSSGRHCFYDCLSSSKFLIWSSKVLNCTLEDVELVEKWHSAISFCSKFTSWRWGSRYTRKLQAYMRFNLIICPKWRNHRISSSLTLIRIQKWVYEMWRIQIWFYSRLSGTWGEVGLRPPYPPSQVSLERSHVVMANYSNWFLIAFATYLLTYTPSHFAHTVQ